MYSTACYVNHYLDNRTGGILALTDVWFVVASLLGALVFIAVPGFALSASYCGQMTGVDSGGIEGNRALVSITSLVNGQHVTNPDVTVSGTAAANPLGRSLWGVPDTDASSCTTSPDGNDFVDTGSISDIQVELNGTSLGNCSDQQVACVRNADWSNVDYARSFSLRPGINTIRVVAQHGFNQWIAQRCNAAPFSLGIGTACELGTPAAPAERTITVVYDQVGSLQDGQIIGRCTGWPSPHVEIEWSRNAPDPAIVPNSNSILRGISSVNSGIQTWFFGGGNPPPGVAGTRLNGSPASPVGSGGYPNPNFSVYGLRDDSVRNFIGSTFTYRVKYRPETPSIKDYTVTVNAASCAGGPTDPPPTPTPTPPPGDSSAGTILGTCTWSGGSPRVNLRWSLLPPPNSGPAGSIGVQKGDSFPNLPQRYWDFLQIGATQDTYTDTAVQINTRYQYRVRYRPDLVSLNTYNVLVTAANCGGPPPLPVPLFLLPSFQIVPPNVTAFLTATGGMGSFTWSNPDGVTSGAGPEIGTTFTNGGLTPVTRLVSVQSGTQTASAQVQVAGIKTFSDSINLVGRGDRYVLINSDAPYVYDPNVMLTLSHGFAGANAADVKVRLSNTLEGVTDAPLVSFQETMPWNICAGLTGCSEGLYSVFAIFADPSGSEAKMVLDNVVYLLNPPNAIGSVLINRGDAATADRRVNLALEHGFENVPEDEITVQLANDPALVNSVTPFQFGAFYPMWDLCDGLGSLCPNGQRFVYAKYCARGQCNPVVRDDILLHSLWPEWGVTINGNSASTDLANVQLALNPWFNLPGTEVYISNMPDMLDAIASPWTDVVPWDLCFNRAGGCPLGDYTVYVTYINDSATSWPGAQSPRYQDDISYLTVTPTPTPPVGPPGILINNGAATTDARFVTVNFNSPFGIGTNSEMRPNNEAELSERDLLVIAVAYGGGIESQPMTIRIDPSQTGNDLPELETGSARVFAPSLARWDLCKGKVDCPFGTYRIFVQYYRRAITDLQANLYSATMAVLGDQVSLVYLDTIEYSEPTPTPSSTLIPSFSPLPSGSTTPSPTDTTTPNPIFSEGPVCTGVFCIFTGFTEAFGGAQPVLGPLALISAIVVAMSAVLTLLPLIGPGLLAFSGQWLLGAMGLLPARKKTWGTVYDSTTKRPIPYAKVQLLDRNRRVLEARVADKDGRYGFLTTPESLQAQNIQIYLMPIAPGYAFPSHAIVGIDLFVYNNLYRGDLITVQDSAVISFDIPMDPTKQKTSVLFTTSPSIALGAAVAVIADAGFWLGLIIVPLNFLANPNPFTFGTLCLFLGTASLRLFGISEHPFGTVSDAQNGNAMPYALITLNDMGGKRVAFAVSDERGRYVLVVERGFYELTAFTPATIQPTRQSKQVIEVKKGWVTRSLKL